MLSPLPSAVAWGLGIHLPPQGGKISWGNAVYTAAELKTMQEVITLLVFAGFSVVYLDEAIRWNHLAGFACLIAAVFFVFHKW